MFLPKKHLLLQLKRSDCVKQYLNYEDHLVKISNCKLRIEFLKNCKRADIIPKFLKFRIPINGCFDDKLVHDFQRKLLQKEFISATENLKELNYVLKEIRDIVKRDIPRIWFPSVILWTRIKQTKVCQEGKNRHNEKLCMLSEEQEKPLFSVSNTVRLFEIDKPPPQYVIDTLSLGPRNPV